MALMKMPTYAGGGGSSNFIGVLDSTYDGSSGSVETLTCPLSCASFQIIATDIRSAVLRSGLKVNGTVIPSANYTDQWQSTGAFGGRVTVNFPLTRGDTISYESNAGTSGSHSAVTMFVE